jgi:hypothetical protein
MRISKVKDYSVSKKLREDKKSNDYFEIMIGNLTLEELIALKLELSYKNLDFPLYGFPLWRSTPYIIKDAILKCALSINNTKKQARLFLGLQQGPFWRAMKTYKLDGYFATKEKGDGTN